MANGFYEINITRDWDGREFDSVTGNNEIYYTDAEAIKAFEAITESDLTDYSNDEYVITLSYVNENGEGKTILEKTIINK